MLRLSTTVLRRSYTTASNVQEAWLYIDSVFPIQLAAWEYAHIALLYAILSLTSVKSSPLHWYFATGTPADGTTEPS